MNAELSHIQKELSAFLQFRDSLGLQRSLTLGEQASQMLHAHKNPSIAPAQLIIEQFSFWQQFADAMIIAQKEYIGSQLGQGGNKADHSLEVGEGVALLFERLAKIAGYDPTEQELDYIRFRGHLHDGGRILNLSDSILDQKRPEFDGLTAREVATNAARYIVDEYSEASWRLEDVRDAICFTCKSHDLI